ncbi:MAG: hypothetical protein H6686_01530 [Fibrobacteria bacterium]|nr:hypothetical protein [Fibrobacteria bacterium]
MKSVGKAASKPAARPTKPVATKSAVGRVVPGGKPKSLPPVAAPKRVGSAPSAKPSSAKVASGKPVAKPAKAAKPLSVPAPKVKSAGGKSVPTRGTSSAPKPAKKAPVTKPTPSAKSKSPGKAPVPVAKAASKNLPKSKPEKVVPPPKKPSKPVAKDRSVSPEVPPKPSKIATKEVLVSGKGASKAAKSEKTLAEVRVKAGKPEFAKGPFFQEVAPGSPAARKTKTPQAPASSPKKPKGEESHDELIARIERELLTVRMVTRKVQRAQICTKCCINPVEPGYMVDRDTGYCAECAIVLGLGHTREARQQNFHPSLMKAEEGENFAD